MLLCVCFFFIVRFLPLMARSKAASPKPKPSPKVKAKSKSVSTRPTIKAKAKAGAKTGAKGDSKQKLLKFTTCPDLTSSTSLSSRPQSTLNSTSSTTHTTDNPSSSSPSSLPSQHSVDKSSADSQIDGSASTCTLNRQDRLMYLQQEIASIQKCRKPASDRDRDVDLHWDDQCWGVFYDPDGD